MLSRSLALNQSRDSPPERASPFIAYTVDTDQPLGNIHCRNHYCVSQQPSVSHESGRVSRCALLFVRLIVLQGVVQA
ncbi:hypothetical protein GN956_G8744 [Arapaima gigas]